MLSIFAVVDTATTGVAVVVLFLHEKQIEISNTIIYRLCFTFMDARLPTKLINKAAYSSSACDLTKPYIIWCAQKRGLYI